MPTLANLEPMSHLVLAGFVGGTAAFADANGRLKLVDARETTIDLHEGLLVAEFSLDGKSLITGGEDGKVLLVAGDGSSKLVSEQKGKWIDRVAGGPQNAVAWASGRTAWVKFADGKTREFDCQRTIEGLAFAPKGMRLAFARYNGVELVWVNTGAPPQFLEWKGAHTSVNFSPDGKYVVTTMQENALHGWRIADQKPMRMSGYPAKVKSVSWSPKGRWLATSGAPAAIVWPFVGKDGPMGKRPLELASMGTSQVTRVCCNPVEDVIAVGYSDGMIMAVRIEDGRMIALRRGGSGEITTLGWSHNGLRLAFGSSEGEAGIISLTNGTMEQVD